MHPPLVDEAIARTAALGGPFSFVTIRMRRKVGSPVWMEVTSRQVLDPVAGELRGFVTVLRDISERKQFEERLVAQALTDGPTGLANRRSFDETLDREWKRTLREGSQLSLLLVDIDHFKSVNDRYGHQVGDDYMRIISAAVCGAVRSQDTVARYGGEEIAVILPCAGGEAAVEAAQRVRTAIEALQLTYTGNPSGGRMGHCEHRRGYRPGPAGRDDQVAGVPAVGGGQCLVQGQARWPESSGDRGSCGSQD